GRGPLPKGRLPGPCRLPGRRFTAGASSSRSDRNRRSNRRQGDAHMKILTLIAATGATLALVAPTAGAQNALTCAASVEHTVTVPSTGNGAQIRRDMLYIGTFHPALTASTCKSLQSAKGVNTPSTRFQVDRDSL